MEYKVQNLIEIDDASVRERIVKLRKNHGLNQDDVAKILGIERGTYASWETRSKLKQEVVVKLAQIYNVSCDYILTGRNISDRLSVASPANYNKDVYGDTYVSELSNFEKAVLLKLRVLNMQDKQKVVEFIDDLEVIK